MQLIHICVPTSALLEGEPIKNTDCDSKISGESITWLPKLQGTISGPPTSPLLWSHVGEVSCRTLLETGDSQSVLLTVSSESVVLI